MNNIEISRKLREITDQLASEEDVARQKKEREEALGKITRLEVEIEGIRDYRYKLIPDFLLKMARLGLEKGIPNSVSPEVYFTDIVIEAISKYLKM